MKPRSKAVTAMRRSGIREIMDLAWRTPDVLHLEVGEPNFPTPDHIVEAAVRAARGGYTKYTPNRGLVELREAIVGKLETHNRIAADIDDIVVTTGATNALILAFMVLVDPGDVVLLPDLEWPNLAMTPTMLNARVVRYRLEPNDGFLPDIDGLDRLCRSTSNVKVLVLNSPSNPTGAVYPRSVVEGLVELAERHDLYVISDECYEDIVFEGEHVSPASVGSSDRIVSVFSVSKSYAMTGWRLGYAVAGEALARDMAKTQEIVTACANAVSQKAAEAAIRGDQDCVVAMREAYRERRDLAVGRLDEAGLLVSRPGGAFYIMADTGGCGLDGYEFCRRLITEHGVALAPGEAFGEGGEGKVRISLAADIDVLDEGLARFEKAVAAWC